MKVEKLGKKDWAIWWLLASISISLKPQLLLKACLDQSRVRVVLAQSTWSLLPLHYSSNMGTYVMDLAM